MNHANKGKYINKGKLLIIVILSSLGVIIFMLRLSTVLLNIVICYVNSYDMNHVNKGKYITKGKLFIIVIMS